MRLRPAVDRSEGRSGAAAAEMAIIIPFIMFLFVVVLDYCRVYNAAQVVNNAARSGALYASGTAPAPNGITPLQAAQQAAVAEGGSLNPPLQPSDVTLTTSAGSVTVAVTHQFHTASPYLGLPRQIDVSAAVTMPISPGMTR